MQLKVRSIEELKMIIKNDYKVDLSDEDANRLGFSLLKLSKSALTALDVVEDKHLLAKSIIN